MSIGSEEELRGMKKASEAVAQTLKYMRERTRPGMTTKELDDLGGHVLKDFGARSAPTLSYGFPGHTCISVNQEVAHGIPSIYKTLKEGDLVNIDVSAELDGYWSDNGGSFVLGEDINKHEPLITASKEILKKAIMQIKGGVKLSEIGNLVETEAAKRGYRVIKNLAGHGIGKSLHEDPLEILNCYDRSISQRFRKNSVVAIETFIATHSTYALEQADGWTLVGNKGGFVAQHEHTIVITDGNPIILTEANGIWA